MTLGLPRRPAGAVDVYIKQSVFPGHHPTGPPLAGITSPM
jgi:hypothetical protein